MMRKLALFSIFLLIWGCNSGKQDDPGIKKNVVPGFKGETFDGDKINERDLRGKVTALSFINSWCIPCMKELVSLNALMDSLSLVNKDFKAYCLTYESKEEFDSLLDSINFKIPIVQVDSTIFFAFKIKGIPTRLLTRDCEVIYRMEGYSPRDAEVFMEKAKKALE